MPYSMHSKHFENVMSFSCRERYEYALGRIADWEELWVLSETDGSLFTRCSPDNAEYMMLWPHPSFAVAYNKEFGLNLDIEVVDVYEFVEHWLPRIASLELSVVVFPSMKGNARIMDPSDLQDDLLEQLSEYE